MQGIRDKQVLLQHTNLGTSYAFGPPKTISSEIHSNHSHIVTRHSSIDPYPPDLSSCSSLSRQMIARSWQMSDSHLQSQVDHWKRLAQDKNRELETFRQELDSILDILRHLHRQGVVLPFPAPISHRSEPTHADTLKVLDI